MYIRSSRNISRCSLSRWRNQVVLPTSRLQAASMTGGLPPTSGGHQSNIEGSFVQFTVQVQNPTQLYFDTKKKSPETPMTFVIMLSADKNSMTAEILTVPGRGMSTFTSVKLSPTFE